MCGQGSNNNPFQANAYYAKDASQEKSCLEKTSPFGFHRICRPARMRHAPNSIHATKRVTL
jgi:hypothetical protein